MALSVFAVCWDLKFLVKYSKYEKSNKMTSLKIDCAFVHINETPTLIYDEAHNLITL